MRSALAKSCEYMAWKPSSRRASFLNPESDPKAALADAAPAARHASTNPFLNTTARKACGKTRQTVTILIKGCNCAAHRCPWEPDSSVICEQRGLPRRGEQSFPRESSPTKARFQRLAK